MSREADPNGLIQPFDYEGVQLLDGLLGNQFRSVRDFYLSIPNDDILKDFRLRAGLPAPGKLLGGWYTYSLHHQSTFGEWLAALACMYKVTRDTAERDRALYLMDEWAKAMDEDRPLYAYCNLVEGLVNIYKYIGNKSSLEYLERITEQAEKRIREVKRGSGDLCANLYRAYEVSGDKHYFELAKLLEPTEFWGLFARNQEIFAALKYASPREELSPPGEVRFYHGYGSVDTLAGANMAYRLTGERHYLDTMINGFQYFQDTQCFATGGYGPNENLIMPDFLPDILEDIRHSTDSWEATHFHFVDSAPYAPYHFETACGSWAAFKLSRYLMMFTGEAHYGDWIERLAYNAVLALIPTKEDGTIMYGSRYHLYGAQKTVWAPWSCCTGTFPQAVTEYHNLIYFYDKENLYVNLFVPSKVEWNGPNGLVTVVQETRFPEEDTVLIHVQPKAPGRFGLKFRVPGWAKTGVKVKVNNTQFNTETSPGKWAAIERRWSPSDIVALKFDLSPRLEPLTRYVSPVALLCGPVVMVTTLDPRGIPTNEAFKHPADWLEQSNGGLEYSTSMQAWDQVFRPYYRIKEGEYYRMYFERPNGTPILPDQLVFHKKWSSDETMRYAEEPGSYFEAKFEGTTLVWEGMRNADGGTAQVSVDGKKVAEVDQYAYNGVYAGEWMWVDQRKVPFRWSISNLTDGEHTIRVTVLPDKNPASSGTKVNVRRLTAYP